MILIVVKAIVKKDKLELFNNIALELVKNTRTETGCIEYSVYEDQKNDTLITFVEKWQDEASIEGHSGTDFFKERITKLQNYSTSFDISINKEII